MQYDLAGARMAHCAWWRPLPPASPDLRRLNRIWRGRTLVGRAAIGVVEKAMEVAGRRFVLPDVEADLERLFRDIQGARFHRPQERSQLRFSGRLALGLDDDE